MFKNGKRSRQFISAAPRPTQEQSASLVATQSESLPSIPTQNSEQSTTENATFDLPPSHLSSCTSPTSFPSRAKFAEGMLHVS
jgi:hypothetical protein